MPTNRRPKVPELRVGAITPAAVELWGKLRRCRSEDAERELVLALHSELRLPPWIESPWDAVGRCPYSPGCAGAVYWPVAVGLRRALAAAAA